jgi:hypothetical protein
VTPRPVSSLLCALLVTASCLPAPDVAQLVLDDDDDVLVLFIHGAGPGEDPSVWADATAADVVGALDEDGVVGVRVHAWDWSARSGTRELAPSAAGDEGRAIADVITDSAVSHVHVVAHSAGAGVATALVEGLVDAGGTTTTHLTLLDPFSLFGVVDCGRATVCEAWRNSDDGAPGSDAPVPTAFNVDVGAAVVVRRAGPLVAHRGLAPHDRRAGAAGLRRQRRGRRRHRRAGGPAAPERRRLRG